MTPLEAVQLANTGVLLWDVVGPFVQQAMENGTDINLEDVEAASIEAGHSLDGLRAAIAAKKLRDAPA